MTTSFRFAAFACLCGALLAAAGCSKTDATAEDKPTQNPVVAGTFDADPTISMDAMPAVDPAKALVTVDGEVLTYGDADAMVKRMLASQGAPEEQLDAILAQMGGAMRERVTDQFIVSTLLKKEANARKIEITEAEVDSTLSNLTTRLPPDTDLDTALAGMGMTLAQVRKDIRENESIRKLYESETAKVAPPTDDEVAAFYAENAERFTTGEEVTARHILIGAREADEATKAAAKAKAEGIRKQLVEGADFAELAAANSDCPSKADGGSLGSFGRGRMVPAFDEAAFALPVNAISEVVETPFGFHVIQVTERTEGGKRPLEEMREQLSEQLAAQKKNEAFELTIEGLRAKATIVRDQPPEAADRIEAFEDDDAIEATEATEAPEAVVEAVPAAPAQPEAATAPAAE